MARSVLMPRAPIMTRPDIPRLKEEPTGKNLTRPPLAHAATSSSVCHLLSDKPGWGRRWGVGGVYRLRSGMSLALASRAWANIAVWLSVKICRRASVVLSCAMLLSRITDNAAS